nr:myb-like domain, Myb/SANT-like DNA-binding domain protein [Tanacetum cinerariifolium]
DIGTPCRETISLMYNLVRVPILSVSQVGMKCADLTKSAPHTKNMMTGKWTRMHGDCQMFNAIYKHLTRKSRENESDHIENAKTNYMERYGNIRFQYVHARNILKSYPKWDATEPIDEDNLVDLFGPDPSASRRLELHIASALVVEKLSLGLRPRCISCFSRRCPILNCFNLGRVNMKSLTIN